jgi:hypothetical protein
VVLLVADLAAVWRNKHAGGRMLRQPVRRSVRYWLDVRGLQERDESKSTTYTAAGDCGSRDRACVLSGAA